MRSSSDDESACRPCLVIINEPAAAKALISRLEILQGTALERGERALQVYLVAAGTNAQAVDGKVGKENDGAPDATMDRADMIGERLGSERSRCLHDARYRVDPALLAADAGTLRRGGVMVLLLAADCSSRHARRLRRLLTRLVAERPDITGCDPLSYDALDALRHWCAEDTMSTPLAVASHTSTDDHTAAVRAQDDMLEELERYLLSGPRRVARVSGARGRGKSALLGRLAARLARRGMTVTLVAARQSATASVWRHYRQEREHTSSSLTFRAPDDALLTRTDLLLVDEAASLSISTITQLLEKHPRVVMATTVDGHESAGRAFALQMPAILDRACPGWKSFSPQAPLRWRNGDSLEAFFAAAFAGRATNDGSRPASSATIVVRASAAPARTVTVQAIDRDRLADDDALLADVFGLLSTTHYQSTLIDLAHLLDAPGLRLWSATRKARVVGVVVVVIEAGMERSLHAAVLSRRRRPPHQLLPSLLAQSADSDAALGATFARVLRIAVEPAMRRRGIASRLLDTLERDVGGNVEAIGASFGDNPASSAFWARNGFIAFHRGYRKNARSGQHSLAVLKARSARTEKVLDRASRIHRDNRQVVARPGASAHEQQAEALSLTDVQILTRFVQAERPLSDTLAAMDRLLAQSGAASPGARQALARGDAPALLDALGLPVAASRKLNHALLREWAAERLDAAHIERASAT